MSENLPKRTDSTQIALFNGREIRKTIHNNEWWFVVSDVVQVLTDTPDAKDYIRKMRDRDEEFGKGWGQIVTPLSIQTSGGPQMLNCANTEGVFRIIQSIPSPKAEPFKRWLAKVGYERVQEIENPELAQNRMKELYEKKGYPKDWIDKRLRGIAIRQNLTDEWRERGIQSKRDFAILTSEISKAAFDLTPSEYKKLKGLNRPNQNLRDHMSDLELIFTMLGERVTTEISEQEKPETFEKNKIVAKRGGRVAGTARKETEKELGRSIVTKQNFLPKKG
ncbi:MAG: Bro-N domain-containing protein [Fibrobacterota bacterium]